MMKSFLKLREYPEPPPSGFVERGGEFVSEIVAGINVFLVAREGRFPEEAGGFFRKVSYLSHEDLDLGFKIYRSEDPDVPLLVEHFHHGDGVFWLDEMSERVDYPLLISGHPMNPPHQAILFGDLKIGPWRMIEASSSRW